jgi:hypothetical protein
MGQALEKTKTTTTVYRKQKLSDSTPVIFRQEETHAEIEVGEPYFLGRTKPGEPCPAGECQG